MGDFGDILDQWDRGRRSGANKKNKKKTPSPRTKRPPSKGPGRRSGRSTGGQAMERWLESYPPPDQQDNREETEDLDHNGVNGVLPAGPQAVIDLHGMTSQEARAALHELVTRSRKEGLRKVLVIHGKGHHSKDGPVLREVVRDFLERSRLTGASGEAPRALGGAGATWFVIRR